MPSQDLFTALNDDDNMSEEYAEVQYNFFVKISFKILDLVMKYYSFFLKFSNRYYLELKILKNLF